MRHRNAGKKLGRTAQHRRALFANLANALIEHERITTTEAKAKDLRKVAERLVSKAKRGLAASEGAKRAMTEAQKSGENPKKYAASVSAVHARRVVYAYLRNSQSVERLFGELAARYQTRGGGYTRIIKVGPRAGDNAPMAIIEFVDRPEKVAASEES